MFLSSRRKKDNFNQRFVTKNADWNKFETLTYILSNSIPTSTNINQETNNINKTRKKAIVEYLDYHIPVTQLKGPKGNGDMQAVRRD